MAEMRKCHCCGTITEKDVCPKCYVSVVNDGIKPVEEPVKQESPKPDTTKTRKTRKEV